MKRTLCVVSILFAIAASARTSAAQSGDPIQAKASNAVAIHSTVSAPKEAASEVELLKHRIEELENQNRAMMQLLFDLKARVEESAHLANASNTRMEVTEAGRFERSPKSDNPSSASRPSAGSAKPAVHATLASSGSGSLPEANSSVQQSDQLKWSSLLGEGNTFKLYGFLRLDLDFDSQRPNNGQAPLFITSQDPRLGKPDAGSFSMHPRLTRFGVDYTGKPIGGLYDGKVAGKLELDFENGGSESRQIIRIRQAYLRVNWGQFSILGGQAWDVVSPLLPTVNSDTAM